MGRVISGIGSACRVACVTYISLSSCDSSRSSNISTFYGFGILGLIIGPIVAIIFANILQNPVINPVVPAFSFTKVNSPALTSFVLDLIFAFLVGFFVKPLKKMQSTNVEHGHGYLGIKNEDFEGLRLDKAATGNFFKRRRTLSEVILNTTSRLTLISEGVVRNSGVSSHVLGRANGVPALHVSLGNITDSPNDSETDNVSSSLKHISDTRDNITPSESDALNQSKVSEFNDALDQIGPQIWLSRLFLSTKHILILHTHQY